MNKYELIYDLKEHLDTYSQTYDDYNMTYNQVEMIYYHIKELQQENQQLKIQISAREEEYRKLENNWRKLKALIKEELFKAATDYKLYDKSYILDSIDDKMQELERDVNNGQ